MPVDLPEPDGIIQDAGGDEVPVWQCPHCQEMKRIEDFGWRKRDDIYPGQDVWHKQSWRMDCRGQP